MKLGNLFGILNFKKIFFISTVAAICFGLWPACSAYAGETDEKMPPMPKGYENDEEVKTAILTGKVKLIDAINVKVPDSVVEEKGIEYGKVGDRSLQLDLYRPMAIKKPVPGLIFIHGGGWKGGSREVMKYYTVRYAERGYVTATISYRFSQEAPFPAAVSDAKCAVRWMRENAKKHRIDPEKIGIIGGSAGAHLAMMTGYSSDVPELEGEGGHAGVSSRVQAVLEFYGPTDLTTEFARKQSVAREFLSGKSYEEAPDLYVLASPISHLTKNDPPTLILHGTIDTIVPIAQADKLAEKLTELGIAHVYEKFEGWPHTMDLAEAVNQRCQYRMNEFLDKYLPLPK
ncbi:MAG: alpha/beta hydrolase [bacterium]